MGSPDAHKESQARILTAEGQAKAIRTVFNAIHEANPSQKVLAYQYLQALPQIANGQANKMWIVPAELTKALKMLGQDGFAVLEDEISVEVIDIDFPKDFNTFIHRFFISPKPPGAHVVKQALPNLKIIRIHFHAVRMGADHSLYVR